MADPFTSALLSNKNLGDDGLLRLLSEDDFQEFLPQIRHLDLSRNNLTHVSVQDLAKEFGPDGSLHELTSLNLSGNSIGSAGWQALAESLHLLPRLSALDLSHSVIGLRDFEHLCSSLSQCSSSLTSLRLNFIQLAVPSVSYEGVPPTIRNFLTTHAVPLSELGLNGLRVVLRRHPQLQVLQLAGNGFSSEIVSAILAAAPEGSGLESLDLSDNNLMDDGLLLIADHLHTVLQHVQDLNVSGCSATYVGICALIRALSTTRESFASSLTRLRVARNSLGSKHVRELVSVLDHVDCLDVLDLSSLGCPRICDLALAFAPRDQPHDGHDLTEEGSLYQSRLRTLIVRDNNIDSASLERASQLLLGGYLKSLDLSHNPIGDQGILTFCKYLRTNDCLLHLDLSHTNLNDRAAFAVHNALQSNTTLISLNLSWNHLGHRGCSAIQDVLSNPNRKTKAHFDLTANNTDQTPAQPDVFEYVDQRDRRGSQAYGFSTC